MESGTNEGWGKENESKYALKKHGREQRAADRGGAFLRNGAFSDFIIYF